MLLSEGGFYSFTVGLFLFRKECYNYRLLYYLIRGAPPKVRGVACVEEKGRRYYFICRESEY